jgi:hypothetical protein
VKTFVILLERGEGTLTALVSPVTPGGYLLVRTITLSGLATVETVAVVSGYTPFNAGDVVFGIAGSSIWGAVAFIVARQRLRAPFRDTRATGGR